MSWNLAMNLDWWMNYSTHFHITYMTCFLEWGQRGREKARLTSRVLINKDNSNNTKDNTLVYSSHRIQMGSSLHKTTHVCQLVIFSLGECILGVNLSSQTRARMWCTCFNPEVCSYICNNHCWTWSSMKHPLARLHKSLMLHMIKHETSSCKITQIFSIAYDQAWNILLQDYTNL
jgi:hypothetical protein